MSEHLHRIKIVTIVQGYMSKDLLTSLNIETVQKFKSGKVLIKRHIRNVQRYKHENIYGNIVQSILSKNGREIRLIEVVQRYGIDY